MLSYFPKPYPGELFYSVLARYFRRSLETNEGEFLYDLYNSKMKTIGKCIPYNLKRVLDRLDVFDYPSASELVRNHTLYYYYTNFHPPIEVEKTYSNIMYGETRRDKVMSNGMNLFYRPKYFKFCKKCMQEDYKKYGETYWRALFQTTTVLICPKHKIVLDDSTVLITSDGLIPATKENCIHSLLDRKVTKKTLLLLLSIAEETKKLTNKNYNMYQKCTLHTLTILKNMGLLDRYGALKKQELIDRLINFFGFNFLTITGFDPNKFVNEYSDTLQLQYFKYIEQLLLIIFLTRNITEFVNAPLGSLQSYSKCKNVFCLEKPRLRFTLSEKDLRRPVSTIYYNCKCGLHFECLFGDDDIILNSSKSYFFDKVLWGYIDKYIYKKRLSLDSVANKLNIDVISIESVLHKNFGLNEKKNENDYSIYREAWYKKINSNPDMHYLELKYSSLPIYTWLYRNDKTWLDETVKDIKGKELSPMFIDKRDNMLKEHLRKHVHSLIINQYKGDKILRRLRFPFIVDEHMKNELPYFPKTINYISKVQKIHKKSHQMRS